MCPHGECWTCLRTIWPRCSTNHRPRRRFERPRSPSTGSSVNGDHLLLANLPKHFGAVKTRWATCSVTCGHQPTTSGTCLLHLFSYSLGRVASTHSMKHQHLTPMRSPTC